MSWRHALVLVTFLIPVGAAGACSDPPAKPPAGGGSIAGGTAGGSSDGGTDGAADSGTDTGDAGTCNDLVPTGQVVDRIGVVGEPPAGKGGTIVDGDYNLIDYSVFTGAGGIAGPTGITAKAALRIAAGRFDEHYEFGGSGNPSVRTASSTYSATAATFATTQVCPAPGTPGTLQFTANDPLLVLTDLATKEAFTFTKR